MQDAGPNFVTIVCFHSNLFHYAMEIVFPQRRGKKLICKALLINIVLWSLLLGIIRIARDVVGLLDMNVSFFLRISSQFFVNAIYIFYNALTIIRYLFIVVWKRMRGVQDKFWSWLFYLSAYSLSFWINIVFILTGYHPDQGLLICITAETQENVALNNKNITTSNR